MHSDSMITRESIPKSFSRNTGRHLAEIMSEHIVERAIIMAAGIGQRLRPVTLTTPKPLVTVNGVCMIDTIIAALHENEIHEIYVVVGYLKEQFYEWAKKYNGITLIENPWYAECNNIASLYVAREYLNNAIVWTAIRSSATRRSFTGNLPAPGIAAPGQTELQTNGC